MPPGRWQSRPAAPLRTGRAPRRSGPRGTRCRQGGTSLPRRTRRQKDRAGSRGTPLLPRRPVRDPPAPRRGRTWPPGGRGFARRPAGTTTGSRRRPASCPAAGSRLRPRMKTAGCRPISDAGFRAGKTRKGTPPIGLCRKAKPRACTPPRPRRVTRGTRPGCAGSSKRPAGTGRRRTLSCRAPSRSSAGPAKHGAADTMAARTAARPSAAARRRLNW